MTLAQEPAGYIYSLETEHYTFEGHGLTLEAAHKAIMATLKEHGRQCGLEDDWHELYADSIQHRMFMPDIGTRDGTPCPNPYGDDWYKLDD